MGVIPNKVSLGGGRLIDDMVLYLIFECDVGDFNFGSSLMVRNLMNDDGLPLPTALEAPTDFYSGTHRGVKNVGNQSKPNSKMTHQRTRPWHSDAMPSSHASANDFTPSYRTEPLLHAAMKSLNMKSCRRNANDNRDVIECPKPQNPISLKLRFSIHVSTRDLFC